MRLTPFGKTVRAHRLEGDLSLGAMADRVGVSAAFASAVETGSKKIPPGYVEKVAAALGLNSDQADDLQNAADISSDEVKLSFDRSAPRSDRETVAMFARRFPDLPADKKDNLRKILEGIDVE